ncbi:UvrB/uvrC motif containing protein, putative [Angomonas deanei]|uniref:UvrB/uvrC motif containing protein, putative n=1 Tax=Angomonas deanei TaxID=59799 RepID=A0A7G2CF49_9TRYP|nr:UvrB/uvrC motif containing protein, putative [Angomonas deanei]
MFKSEEKYGPRLALTLCSYTSEDDGYRAAALVNQTPTSCGWQSAKHCQYPQELIFHFDGAVTLNCLRILSHERKISSCIDVYIAQSTVEEIEAGVSRSLLAVEFVRLGHVRLDQNTLTNFSARELKTIGIQRQCSFVKLVLRKPHHNTYNLFQQVGLVAITAHGQMNRSISVWKDARCAIPVGEMVDVPLEQMVPLSLEEINTQSSSNTGTGEVMRRIKELDALKTKAISEEDYDLAAALKKEMDTLRDIGSKIAALEKEKDDAVRREDYTRAKEIKTEIQNLQSGPTVYVQAPPPVAKAAVAETQGSPAVQVAPSVPAPAAQGRHDEMKVGGKGYYDIDAAEAKSGTRSGAANTGSTISTDAGGAAWEKKLNNAIMKHCTDDIGPTALTGNSSTEGAGMEKDLGVFATACLWGKKGQLREAAVRGCFSDEGFSALMSHSAGCVDTLLLYFDSKGHGINDPVAGVVFATCEAVQKLANGSLPNSPPLSSIGGALNNLAGDFVLRTGDNNSRIRENVEGVLVTLARSTIGPDKIVSLLLVDPDKQGKKPAGVRTHVSRINLLTTFVDDFGVDPRNNPKALDSNVLMNSVVLPSLRHSNGEVRECAIKLFAKLLILDKRNVQQYFDGIKPAQQSLVEAQIDSFNNEGKKVDGGPDITADVSMISSSKPPPAREREPSPKKAAKRKESIEQPSPKSAPKRKESVEQPSPRSEARKTSASRELESRVFKTCQFCDEYNPSFTEAALDIHYVRSCPMLCPCPLCDQVTEISTLQEHLVSECELKDMVRACPRCHEAVTVEDYDEHVASKSCIDAKKSISVCPLCHAQFRAGAEGWQSHLAKAPGCPNNPRAYDGSGPIGV